MTPADLQRIANAGGYGTGQAARDRMAAEAEIRHRLPDPRTVPPVMASTNCASNWLIASFGYDDESDNDWHLVTCDVRASETRGAALVQGAKDDAETVAAIINAYRIGIIRVVP